MDREQYEVHMIKDTDIAWMAALLDFKGRFCCTRAKNKSSGIQVSIKFASSDYLCINALCEMVGLEPFQGRGFGKEINRVQCSEHCPNDHVHVWTNRSREFSVQGVSAAIVAHNVAPYMRLAREEAIDIFSKFLPTYSADGRGSSQVLLAIQRLESLGWAIPKEIRDEVR